MTTTTYAAITRANGLATLHHVCDRLNQQINNGKTPNAIRCLVNEWHVCSKEEPLDMLELSDNVFITNFISVLNGLLSFRDEQSRVYRLAQVYSTTNEVVGFAVVVSQAGASDTAFPLFY